MIGTDTTCFEVCLFFFLISIWLNRAIRTQEYRELMAPFITNGVASLGEAHT